MTCRSPSLSWESRAGAAASPCLASAPCWSCHAWPWSRPPCPRARAGGDVRAAGHRPRTEPIAGRGPAPGARAGAHPLWGGRSVGPRDPPSRGDPGARAAQVSGLGDQLWGWSIRWGNGRVGLPTGEIDRHPVAMKVITVARDGGTAVLDDPVHGETRAHSDAGRSANRDRGAGSKIVDRVRRPSRSRLRAARPSRVARSGAVARPPPRRSAWLRCPGRTSAAEGPWRAATWVFRP